MQVPTFAVIPTIGLVVAAFTGWGLAVYILIALGVVIALAEFNMAWKAIKKEEEAERLALEAFRNAYGAYGNEQSLGG